MTKIRKFKVGDTVRCLSGTPKNYVGTVVDESDSDILFVDFGESFVDGHDGGSIISTNTGWWCPKCTLELVKDISVKPIRNPEDGSLPCCEPDACMPDKEAPEDDARDCAKFALSCCLDETPAPEKEYYDAHYDGTIQPIELMQMIMTPEQFIGFLMGNIIKYSMRCGKKDAPEKELTKIRRYKMWLEQARRGEIINPRV